MKHNKIKMHKKMAMSGKSPVGKMGGGMMKPTGYKKGGSAKKPVTVKEITPKGKKGVLIFKGKAKDYKPVGKMGGGMMKPKKAALGALMLAKKFKK